jgi:hypothetical protein
MNKERIRSVRMRRDSSGADAETRLRLTFGDVIKIAGLHNRSLLADGKHFDVSITNLRHAGSSSKDTIWVFHPHEYSRFDFLIAYGFDVNDLLKENWSQYDPRRIWFLPKKLFEQKNRRSLTINSDEESIRDWAEYELSLHPDRLPEAFFSAAKCQLTEKNIMETTMIMEQAPISAPMKQDSVEHMMQEKACDSDEEELEVVPIDTYTFTTKAVTYCHNQLEILVAGEKVWFDADAISKILNIRDPDNAVQGLPAVGTIHFEYLGDARKKRYINEANVYRLLYRSERTEPGERFLLWAAKSIPKIKTRI